MTFTAADLQARFVRNIVLIRERNQLSKAEVGRRMDPPVRHNEVTRWETGRVRLTEQRLLQYAEIFGLDPGWFWAEHANGNGPS